MRLRPFGRTGLEISEIAFGCGTTAALMTGDDADGQARAVAHAIECGINLFDTAPKYGAGASERNLGRALRDIGARPFVATKVVLHACDLGDIAGAVVTSVDRSLVRLEMDRVDIVFLHNRVGIGRSAHSNVGADLELDVDDVLGANGICAGFDALRRAGRIGFSGCCAFGGQPPAVERLIDSDRFDAMLVNYSLLNASAWSLEQAPGSAPDYSGVGASAAARGIGLVALRVLEGGRLTRTVPEAVVANGTRAAQAADASSLAIRFVLSNPQIATALIGFSDVEQIDAAVRAASLGPLEEGMLAAGMRQRR